MHYFQGAKKPVKLILSYYTLKAQSQAPITQFISYAMPLIFCSYEP